MSETTNLHTSLAAVQAELPTVNQSRTVEVETRGGGSYSYTYATLADVHAAVLPLLAKHGLSWACIPDVPDRILTGILTHAETGETLPPALWPLPDTRDPQAIGSAITYGRRYLLSAVVGVVTEDDDDGRRAQHHQQQQRRDTAPDDSTPAVDPRVRAADLVLEYVPHEHHAALWNAYQSGATSVDDLDDENVARVVRALSSKHQRTRVLEGVAQAAAADEEDDGGEDGNGSAPPAGDDDGPDAGPVAPDDAPAPETATQSDDENGSPVELEGDEPSSVEEADAELEEDAPLSGDELAQLDRRDRLVAMYPELNVAQVGELLRKGKTEVDLEGGGTILVALPRDEAGGVLAAYELVEELEAEHHDPRRKTVRGALESAGWTPRGRERLEAARRRATMDEDDEAATPKSDTPSAAQSATQSDEEPSISELLDRFGDLIERDDLAQEARERFRRRLGELITEGADGVPDRAQLAALVRHLERS